MRSFGVAKVLIANDKDEVLVIRRSKTDERRPGEWDVPGGWVDPGEDFTAAVKREAIEEVGLTLKDPKLVFGMSEMTTNYGSGTWFLYIERVTGRPEVTLSSEHDLATWMRLEDLLKEVRYERQRAMFGYVLKNDLLRATD